MELFKLLEVCEVYQPKTISKKELKDDGKYKVYGANGVIGFYEKFNHEESEILLTCRGATCGAVNVSEPFSWINGNAMVVKPIDNLLTRNYIKYFLQTIDKKSVITGAAQPQITRSSLEKLKIPVPSVQEQEKIVDRLDNTYKNINKSIEHDLAKINSLKALFSQLLSKKFEDISNQRNTTIGNEFNLANGATPLKSNKNFYENGEIPFLITGDFKNKLIYETSKFITEEGLENSSAKIYPTNSIVVAMYGATAGKVGILKIECASNQAVCCLYPNDKYDEEFIYYFFLNFKEELVSQATGSAQPNISQQKISKFKFYEINLVQQRKIIHEIKTVENIVKDYIEKTNTKITKYSSLLTSILNKEFSYE